MPLNNEEDREVIEELAGEVIDFFAENALEHECVGIVNFMESIGLEVNPNMVSSPHYMSYVRMDKWDEEAIKWFDNKKEA